MTIKWSLVDNNSPTILTTTPSPNAVPIADSQGTLNSWLNFTTLIASGTVIPLTSQTVTGSGNITTTSTTPTLATGMTITPTAGNYLIWFVSSVDLTVSPSQYIELSIFVGGTQITTSIVRSSDTTGFTEAFACIASAGVDGTQAIEGRWRVTGGAATGTMYDGRTLMVLRIS